MTTFFMPAAACNRSRIPAQENSSGARSTIANSPELRANEGMRNFSSGPSSNLKIKRNRRDLTIHPRILMFRRRFRDSCIKKKRVARATAVAAPPLFLESFPSEPLYAPAAIALTATSGLRVCAIVPKYNL
jgi:hypothetical protein